MSTQQLKWTKQKPTQSGFYWYREEEDSQEWIGECYESLGNMQLWLAGDIEAVAVNALPGEFAGPIARPEE